MAHFALECLAGFQSESVAGLERDQWHTFYVIRFVAPTLRHFVGQSRWL